MHMVSGITGFKRGLLKVAPDRSKESLNAFHPSLELVGQQMLPARLVPTSLLNQKCERGSIVFIILYLNRLKRKKVKGTPASGIILCQ